MADLTHKMENVLDEIRHGNIVVNADIIDVIFECIDNLEDGCRCATRWNGQY